MSPPEKKSSQAGPLRTLRQRLETFKNWGCNARTF